MIPEQIAKIEQRVFLRGYQKFEIRPDGDMDGVLNDAEFGRAKAKLLEQAEQRKIGFS